MPNKSAKLGSPNVVAILPLSQEKIDRRLTGLPLDKVKSLTKILASKNEYMNHPFFRNKKNVDVIFETVLDMSEFESLWNKVLASVGDRRRKEIEQEVSKKKVFTKEEEKIAFLQYNYVRFRLCKIIKIIHRRKVDKYKLDDLIYWYERHLKIENNILLANIGLTLGALGKIRHRDYSDDSVLTSEALAGVLRAIRKFDIAKGWKFSTYATNVIIRSIFREISVKAKSKGKEIIGFDESIGNTAREMSQSNGFDFDEHERSQQKISLQQCLKNNLAELNEQEDKVIRLRFGYSDSFEPSSDTVTLDEAGILIGLTKERIRQVQNMALRKISHCLGGEYHSSKGRNSMLHSGKKVNFKI